MFELPQRALDVAEQVENFFQQRVLPNNKLWEQQAWRWAAHTGNSADVTQGGESLGPVEYGIASAG